MYPEPAQQEVDIIDSRLLQRLSLLLATHCLDTESAAQRCSYNNVVDRSQSFELPTPWAPTLDAGTRHTSSAFALSNFTNVNYKEQTIRQRYRLTASADTTL